MQWRKQHSFNNIMKYAVISDIHSNFESLSAVVADIRVSGVDKVICLGDVVGYGPNPAECVAAIKELAPALWIAGNHDAAVSDKLSTKDFSEDAAAAIEINKNLTSKEEKDFLASVPYSASDSAVFFVHGSPRNPLSEYLHSFEKLRQNISLFDGKICFVGHTHKPLIYSVDESGLELTQIPEGDSMEFHLISGRKYIINAGSVGQPRDGDKRSCFLYYDSDADIITYRRIPYDIAAVKAKMSALHLPEFLINRLDEGI